MPRIKTTPAVKITLFLLLIYLIVMLALILVKFILVTRRPAAPAAAKVDAASCYLLASADELRPPSFLLYP